jgi:leader peptidase (prepilin peptidase)/N-methyltransferase
MLLAVPGSWDFVAMARVIVLAVPLLITIVTDIRRRAVYPAVLLTGLLIAAGVAAYGPHGVLPALLSGVGAGGAMALLLVLSRRIWRDETETPLGDGDILIAVTLGVMLGPERTAPALFAGMVMAAMVAGVLLLTGKARREETVPYGAFLCLAAIIALGM